MRWASGKLVLAVGLAWISGNCAGHADVAPQQACEAAGRAAERNSALPANMLVSIGLVESGRVNPLTGQVAPWPWTVNVDGEGHYFQAEPDAAAFVRLALTSGAQDVDVGCFQISLENHPDAFRSVDLAFDPVVNANFAARFLNQLKIQSGSWNLAIADYHSGLPQLGLPYQRLVMNAWRGIGAVAPGLGPLGFTPDDPGVILEASAARLVRVITPDGELGPQLMTGLPRVITP